MSRTQHRFLNQNNEFFENGMLKEGHNYTGGDGRVALGTAEYSYSTGAGKDGLQYRRGTRTVFGPPPKVEAPPAPTPEPKKEPYKAPEQVGTSDKLDKANQYLQEYTKSGKNFQSNTLSDRQAKTDSLSQKPAYDPDEGISSTEAGNFLNDYKLDLKNTISQMRN